MATYTIGITETLGSAVGIDSNSKSVSLYQNTTGSVVYVSLLYINASDAGTWTGGVKGVVYSNVSGEPSQILATTDEKSDLSAGWNTLSFPSPLPIQPNAYIWVGVISENYIILHATWTGQRRRNADTYSDGASTTFGTGAGSTDNTYNLYLEGYSTPNNIQPRATKVANMRILHDNAADRATITASSTAGNLVASNLQVNHKSVVWRSTSTSATIIASFPTSEMIGCVALPFCNLTSTATIRVRGYADSIGNTLTFDTGTILACPYSSLGMWQWGSQALGVNAFSFGGGAYSSVYTDIVAVKKLVIDIADSANTSGYLECSRLVAGSYWSPSNNPEYGASASTLDTSKQYRTEAGDMLTDVGNTSRKVSLNLSAMAPDDRAEFWRTMRSVGMSKPIFVSVFPECSDPELEQTHQIFGKIPSLGSVSASSYNIYSAPLELEEI